MTNPFERGRSLEAIRSDIHDHVGDDYVLYGLLSELESAVARDATPELSEVERRTAAVAEYVPFLLSVIASGERMSYEREQRIRDELRALAAASAAPRPRGTVEDLARAIDGLVPGGPGITFKIPEPWVCRNCNRGQHDECKGTIGGDTCACRDDFHR